jgi:calcium-dependent protein kinase
MGNFGCCGSQPISTSDPHSDPPISILPQIQTNSLIESAIDSTIIIQEFEKPKEKHKRTTKVVIEAKEHPERTGKPEIVHEGCIENPPEKSPEKEPARKSSASLRFHRGSFVHFTRGDIISMYAVTGTLGKGSFGRVYKVKHKLTNDFRAVKVLSKDNLSEATREKFVYEVEVLRSLDHPNILKVFEVYEDDKQFSIVTELCVGGELFDRIVSVHRFSEKLAAEYMYQIMSAILTCHEKGIVHRDLKPENILFVNESESSPLKIIDFGTSRRLEARSTLSSLTGTVNYI